MGPGRSVTEDDMGRSDYQYYCGDLIMILNVFAIEIKTFTYVCILISVNIFDFLLN